jgi:tight adherence protein B
MMLLPLIVFLVVTIGLIVGYNAMMRLPDHLAARALNRRLNEVSTGATDGDPAAADESVLKLTRSGPFPALDKLLASTGAGGRVARIIEQSGVKITASAVGVMSVIMACVVAGLTMLFLGPSPAAWVAGLVGGIAPIAYLKHRASARLKRFEEQFPEALDLLARAIRAGHAFQTALGMVADEMTDPVGPEFKKTFDQQNYGLPLRDALNEMADRIRILDVRFFVTAVLIQRDTGGNLSEILENLAHVVRERFKILREVRTHTAHGRFTGYVLLALPAALAVALSFINPEHMALLFHERLGQIMIIGAIVMQTIGYLWIRQVIKIEV